MYEMIICPLKRLYQLAQDGDMRNVALLAVSSYDIRREKLNMFVNMLCLSFADVTDSSDKNAFSSIIAEQIVGFVKTLPEETDTLFVCCDCGESRSTAMAAAISRYNRADEMKIWGNSHYHPNPLVYKLLCQAFRVNATDEEINERLNINKEAFLKAVQENR